MDRETRTHAANPVMSYEAAHQRGWHPLDFVVSGRRPLIAVRRLLQRAMRDCRADLTVRAQYGDIPRVTVHVYPGQTRRAERRGIATIPHLLKRLQRTLCAAGQRVKVE